MFKVAAAGATALFVAASPCAYAQNNPAEMKGHMSATEPQSATDLRIETVKAALQLTPDQEKYWPAIEDAIRTRAQHRIARLQDFAQRANEMHDSDPVDLVLNRNPVDFMHRRAAALAQRSADLKKLGDAWQPLYQVLNPDQKQRLALLRIIVLRGVANRLGGPGDQFDDDEEQE